jgi:hypothetical protein
MIAFIEKDDIEMRFIWLKYRRNILFKNKWKKRCNKKNRKVK